MELVLAGIHGITQKLRELEKTPFAKKMMGEIALFVMARIKERTIKGIDVEGHDFVAYAEGYKKWRAKKGYKTAPPDLTFSGHMLSAMTETHTSSEAKLFFMNTQDVEGTAAPDKAFWNNDSREFFGLSNDDIKMIVKIVVDYYEKLTGRRTLK